MDKTSSETSKKSGAQLRSLQAGRGIAATVVLLHHAAYATGLFITPLPPVLATVFNRGLLGVDFFFVLSGFIILNAHYDDPQSFSAFRLYALKRIIRIYAPYLPISLVLIASYIALPSLSQNARDWGWLTSLFLIPSAHLPALAVAWTLVHEMLFYFIFALYFLSRATFAIVIAGWAAMMLIDPAVYVQDGQNGEPLMTVILNPINIEFCFGLLCAIGYRKIATRKVVPWLLSAGTCLLVFFFAAFDKDTVNSFSNQAHIIFGLGIALVILGLCVQEKMRGLAVPKALVRLGDASYSIYLIHVPVISVAVRLAAHSPLLGNWPSGLFFSSCCAGAAGYAYYWFYERPALSAIRKVSYRPKAESEPDAPFEARRP